MKRQIGKWELRTGSDATGDGAFDIKFRDGSGVWVKGPWGVAFIVFWAVVFFVLGVWV